MKKTALFFNGDYHLQKPLTFKQLYEMPFGDMADIFYGRFSTYRMNVGTFLFTDALAKNLDASWVVSADCEKLKSLKPATLVTTWLHHIHPRPLFDLEYWDKYLTLGTKIVPLSCGFVYDKAEDFDAESRKRIVNFFGAVSERNEIGVREEKSADLLNAFGIKNVRVIGCPSMFYHMDRNFKVLSGNRNKTLKSINVCTAFTSSRKSGYNSVIVDYFQNFLLTEHVNVNCTLQQHPIEISLDIIPADGIRYQKKPEVIDFFLRHGRYFFSVDDWIDGVAKDDFSIGTQLHGNMAAILAGIPALYVAVNDKVRYLCRHFKIPYIGYADFDKNLPLQYYYELADYSEFNKNYAAAYDNFVDYCRKNGVDLMIDKNTSVGG